MSSSPKPTGSPWVFDPALSRPEYVRRLLELYRRTPTVAPYVGSAHRRLADELYRRSTPLPLLQAAFALAATRRIFRVPPLLAPIRSLHYFLPVLDELLEDPPDPAYIELLERKLRAPERYLRFLGS